MPAHDCARAGEQPYLLLLYMVVVSLPLPGTMSCEERKDRSESWISAQQVQEQRDDAQQFKDITASRIGVNGGLTPRSTAATLSAAAAWRQDTFRAAR